MSNVIKRRLSGKSWRTLGAAILAAGATLTGLYSAYATTPPANTQISAKASASYKDAGNNELTAYSNSVVVTVQQVGAMSVVSGGKTLTSSTATDTNNDAIGGAGLSVNRAYVLTNTGNGSDSFTIKVTDGGQTGAFSKIEIYADDGLGSPIGSALCSTSGTSCTNVGVSKTLAANETFKYLVVYGIPSNAKDDGTWGTQNATTLKYYRTGVVTVVPTNSSLGYSPASLAATDNIVLTKGAAFTLGMAIDTPAAAPADSGAGTKAWKLLKSGKRSTTTDNTDASKTTWTTFLLKYNNVGAASGALFIKSTVPDGMSYVAGSAVIACNGGTALTDADNGAEGSGVFGNCPAGLQYAYDSATKEIKIYIPSVVVGVEGNISFNLSINSDSSATIGATAATTATAYFTPEGCENGMSDCYTNPGTLSVTATNSSVFEVQATRDVTFNVKDSTAGTPGTAPTSSAAGDGVYSGFIVPGSFVKQKTFVITNAGNAPDTFDLTVAAPTGANEYAACTTHPCTETFKYPAGTTYTWYAVDASGNTSLLQDTNSNGTIDTGVIAAGASKTVALYIQAPSTLTVATDHKLGAVVTATSIYDATIKDASWSIAGQVIGGYVDLTNSASGRTTADSTYGADVGPGPGSGTLPSYITTQIQAGTALAQIPLYIKNYDDADIVFTPSASSNLSFPGTLPSGWSVAFSSTACATAVTPLTNGTITVATGAQSVIYACVTSPGTSPTTSQSVYIKVQGARADSTLVSDIVYTSVPVVAANAYSMSSTAGAPYNVRPGGSVDFSHSITNTGQATCGADNGNNHYLKIEVTKLDGTAITVASGWSYIIYFDGNGNGVVDNSEATITDGKLLYTADNGTTTALGLPVGQSAKFIVRVFAPSNATQGDSLPINVKVYETSDGSTVLSSPSGCGTVTVSDTATVVLSSLSVAKSQSVQSLPCGNGSNPSLTAANYVVTTSQVTPGNCVYYKVVVTNSGTDTAKEVKISDVAPSYTTLQTSAPAPTPTCKTGLTENQDATLDISAPPGITCGHSASGVTVDLTPGAVLTLRYALQVDK